jgi:hypothetical protein
MAPIIYMPQTLLWIAHNDRNKVEQITKQITRAGNTNGINYVVIEN